MDTQSIQAGLVIIGIVNGIRLLKEATDVTPHNYWGFVLFVCALVTGIVLGAFHLFGMTLETGIIAGLASSGLYRVGEKFGGQ